MRIGFKGGLIIILGGNAAKRRPANGPMSNGQLASGLIASELMKPLQASGLTAYQGEAYANYNAYIEGVYGSCED